MDRGYVKLWRKTLDSGLLQSPNVFCFWCWCLLKATYKPHTQIVGFQSVDLQPGEFIFGLNAASKELGLSLQSIRTCLQFLKNSKNLTIKSTNKFSIISIINWCTYQDLDFQSNNQDNKQPTSSQQTTNKQLTTNKKEKKEKKERKERINITLPECVEEEDWNNFLELRKAKKSPLTSKATELILGKLESWYMVNGWSPKDIINQSIENGYTGVFPLKNNNGSRKDNLRKWLHSEQSES